MKTTGEDDQEQKQQQVQVQEEEKKMKAKKTDQCECEENRGIAKAIKEIADVYYTNQDRMKGGVFSKAAKALREAPEPIHTAKEAMKLKGVGKGCAAYIVEFRETGMIVKLEQLRSGEA